MRLKVIELVFLKGILQLPDDSLPPFPETLHGRRLRVLGVERLEVLEADIAGGKTLPERVGQGVVDHDSPVGPAFDELQKGFQSLRVLPEEEDVDVSRPVVLAVDVEALADRDAEGYEAGDAARDGKRIHDGNSGGRFLLREAATAVHAMGRRL